MDDKNAVRIELAGDLDVYRRDEIAAQFPPPESVSRVIVDMRNATLIDSSIVSVLMRYRRAFMDCGNDGLDMVLVVPQVFRRIFEITGLVKLVTVVTAPTVPDDGPKKPLTEA
ncbi:MAG TPA: STAS domain-containing protein [Candidatus Baltobacteraceae bacterium]